MPEPADVPAEVAALRAPLDAEVIGAELRRRGSAWPPPVVLGSVGSTNVEVSAAARDGSPEGFLVVAEEQVSGRGRLARTWVSPRAAGLTLTVLLRPSPPPATWGWLPLIAGLALITAVREVSDLDVGLKWPNDLLLGPDQTKAAGILAESGEGVVVVGIGVNVSTTADELPDGATSLLARGAPVSRGRLLVELVLALQSRYAAWTEANGDADRSGVLAAYRNDCATLGRSVTVHLPRGDALHGIAEAIDPSGGLQVRTADGALTTVVAADVVHVRPTSPPRPPS